MFKVLEKEKRMVIIVKEKRIGVDCGIFIFSIKFSTLNHQTILQHHSMKQHNFTSLSAHRALLPLLLNEMRQSNEN